MFTSDIYLFALLTVTMPTKNAVGSIDGLSCDFRPQQQIKAGESGEEVCIELGQAICRDNEHPFEEWHFGVLDPDEKIALLDPNGNAVYEDFPGATSLCIGEEEYEGFFAFQPPRQPYLYIYDDCNEAILAELTCHDVPEDNEDDPTQLKMTDNSDLGEDTYPVNVVKLRKGRTEERNDDNLLWGIDVDFKSHAELEGKIVTNDEYCVWEEFFSSARCDSLSCESNDCCSVYDDDEGGFVFPICEGSKFCNELNNTIVVDLVEVTLDGTCEDLGTDTEGFYNITGSDKANLEQAIINFSDNEQGCKEGGFAECVEQSGQKRRRLQSDSDPSFDTVSATLISFEQLELCQATAQGRQLPGRNLRSQKSKGKFNRKRRANNRRRKRRKKKRRSRALDEILTKNKLLRRSLQQQQCPASLTQAFRVFFPSTVEATDLEVSPPLDCNDIKGAACAGDDGNYACCGVNDACECGFFVSESECGEFGCDISQICCKFSVCGSSDSCFPTASPSSPPSTSSPDTPYPSKSPSQAPSAPVTLSPSKSPSQVPSGAPTQKEWRQFGENIDGQALNDLGRSVSFSSDGNTIAIGAPGKGLTSDIPGHVKVYTKSMGDWVQRGSNIDGNTDDTNTYRQIRSRRDDSLCIAALITNTIRNDLVLRDCNDPPNNNDDLVLWILDSNGLLRLKANSNRCAARNGDAGGSVRLKRCDLSNDDQVWNYDSNDRIQSEGTFYCMQYRGQDEEIDIQTCDTGSDQEWDFIEGPTTTGDRFGFSVSLSHDGTTVAIGAPLAESNKGKVRVFSYDESSADWYQLGSDLVDDEGGQFNGVLFGYSVSLSNNGVYVAVGAPGPLIPAIGFGYARVYRYNGRAWKPLGPKLFEGEAAGDISGFSVSLSGEDRSVVAIGAPSNGAGIVRILSFNGTDWEQLGLDLNGNIFGDDFGRSVSLSSTGDVVAIGAPNANSARGNVSVYSYNRQIAEWDRLGDGIVGENILDFIGDEVSLSSNGNIVAIGQNNVGLVRVFSHNGEDWFQLGSSIEGDPADLFGIAVSLSGNGDFVAVGAPANDEGGDGAGQVRVYQH